MTNPCPIDKDPRFQHRRPKIFVGVCAFGDIPHEAFRQFVCWWGIQCARLKDKAELYFGVSPRKEQYRARNALVQAAEMSGADFLLMVDDDQLLIPEPDMLQKFMDFGAPVMGGLYYQRGGLFHPVVMHEDKVVDGLGYRFYHPSELPPYDSDPIQVDVVGHGCMWVDMDVYNKLKQPHHWPYPGQEVVFVPDDRMGLDVNFCRRVRHELGEAVWFMPNIRIGHLSHDPEALYEDNRPDQDKIDATQKARDYWGTVCSRIVPEAQQIKLKEEK